MYYCEKELSRHDIKLICDTCKPDGLFIKYLELNVKDYIFQNQDKFFICLASDCDHYTNYNQS